MTLLSFFLASAVAAIPSIDYPIPDQYKGEATVNVYMTTPEKINEICGAPPEGIIKLGCYDIENDRLIVGNPCNYTKDMKDKKTFGYLLCHEKAHKNGWRHP